MGKLTTHVLDTAHGRPCAGILIEVFAIDGTARRALAHTVTNREGRCDASLVEGEALRVGEYELIFHVGDYFEFNGMRLPQPRFIDRVVLRVGIANSDSHYHVPLLVSPWSYSTYRGT